jgi:hypothetical protein
MSDSHLSNAIRMVKRGKKGDARLPMLLEEKQRREAVKEDGGVTDKIEGYLEVGANENGEVVVNLDKDRNGIGHIVFSPNQARAFAAVLNKQAEAAEIFARAGMKRKDEPDDVPQARRARKKT